MHPECISRFLRAQTVMLAPICPHFCHNIWAEVLDEELEMGPVEEQMWPEPTAEYDLLLHRKYAVLEADLRAFRLAKEAIIKDKKKK